MFCKYRLRTLVQSVGAAAERTIRSVVTARHSD